MKKRVVALLLTAGMVLSCLAGCGQKENESTQQSVDSTQESETSSSVEEKVDPVEVTWVIRCAPQEDDEKVLAAINELLAERYNLKLKLVSIPDAEYDEKTKLMITGREDFDLMYTASWTNKLANNVAMGAFLALDDLLKTDAAKDLMEVYPIEMAEVARYGGKLYALPNYQSQASWQCAYIQKDLADKYGLDYENIEYIDDIRDLETFMIKVRDNEPDMYVLNEKQSYGAAIQVPGAKRTATYGSYIDVEEGTLNCNFNLKDKAFIEAKYSGFYWLYENGFVRSDIATVTDNSADYKANRYAITINTYKPGGDVEMSANMGEDYIAIPIGNNPKIPVSAGTDTMTAINVSSKNPEAAIKMYGVFWTDPEIFNMFLFGLEGVHYKKVSENRVELIDGSGYNRSGYGWMMGSQFNAWLLPGQADDVWEETLKLNESGWRSSFAGFTFDTTPVKTELTQLSSVNKEYSNRYKYTPVDEFYQEYYDKMMAAGAQKVEDEVKKQLTAWAQENGKDLK